MTERDAFRARATGTPAMKAPYSFVPTGPAILASPVENLDLSRPVEGALSGCLTVTWTAKTALLVGGGDANDPDNPDNTRPFMVDGRYALPGSTIKGLIRSVMEIAAFARLSFVDDFTAYTRSFNDLTWKEEVKPRQGDSPTGGWLFRVEIKNANGGKEIGYQLAQATATEPIFFADLLPMLPGIPDTPPTWHEADMHTRLTEINSEELNRLRVASGAKLVVSGPTAAPGRSGNTEKNREYLFTWPDDPRTITIDKGTGDRFLASLHKDSNAHTGDPKANYSALISPGGVTGFDAKDPAPLATQLAKPDKYGLPVFWRNPQSPDQSTCRQNPILSLTALLRVPFKKTVHDLIARTQRSLDDDQLDLVQALLGWAPPDPSTKRLADRTKTEKSLRSRVRFGFACSDDAQVQSATKTWAAPKPKPSYWPYYLKANSDQATHPVDYNNASAVLAGRKRYPARGSTSALEGDPDRPDRNQSLTFLQPRASFSGEIRFRNISPIELGALIWAITFGDLSGNQGFFHMLGRAKSHGYGQVEATIGEHQITCARGGTAPDLQAAMAAFTGWVGEQPGGQFDQHPTIRALKGTAHAATGAALRDHLNFPGGQGQAVLDAYGALKKHAQEDRNGVGGQTVTQENGIGLPPYPGVPEE